MHAPSKIIQRQSSKIYWRAVELGQGVLEMFDNAMPDAAPQLMVRGGDLDQALDKKSPRLVVTPPDHFPRLVRFPKLAGVEQRDALVEIGEICLTQPWRARGGVRGRRFQPVPAR